MLQKSSHHGWCCSHVQDARKHFIAKTKRDQLQELTKDGDVTNGAGSGDVTKEQAAVTSPLGPESVTLPNVFIRMTQNYRKRCCQNRTYREAGRQRKDDDVTKGAGNGDVAMVAGRR
jgi:hypothetical protein